MRREYRIPVVICFLVAFCLNLNEVPFNLDDYDSAHVLAFEQLETSGPKQSIAIGETIAIIVESNLWNDPMLQLMVIKYRLELDDTGYNTILHTDFVGSIYELKGLLKGWYVNDGLVGAVLIGDFPIAYFHHDAKGSFPAEDFICDLYFTDLDGEWFDNAPYDEVFESHTGDIYPEIYLGRIDATYRDFGDQTNARDIMTYLLKCQKYKDSLLVRNHKAIMYIDDDWTQWADGTLADWPSEILNTYGKCTTVLNTTTTSNTDWLYQLSQDYEWGHLCVKSDALSHYFEVNGTSQPFTSETIDQVRPTFNFYNLFCEHAADFTINDSLATTYLYSSDYSLAVIGSTKKGGMLNSSYFYDSLGVNKTLGASFLDWFQNIDSYSSDYIEWFYGMVILGDPFLTNDIDTTVLPTRIFSNTHPDQNATYYANKINFYWYAPEDMHEVVSYEFILDREPETQLSESYGILTNYTVITYKKVGDGTWYLHLIAIDILGNHAKKTTHYQVNIKHQSINRMIFGISFGSITVIVIPVYLLVKRKNKKIIDLLQS